MYNSQFAELLKKDLGKGNLTSFWFENWSGNGPLKDSFSELLKLESKKQCLLSDRYEKIGDTFEWKWSWKRSPSSDMEKIELSCCDLILKDINLTFSDDSWKWLPDTSGNFSVSSLRRLCESYSCSDLPYKHFWSNFVPIKTNFLG